LICLKRMADFAQVGLIRPLGDRLKDCYRVRLR
jgi:hypothetical protein